MRAVRSSDGRAQVVDVPEPSGEGVTVKIRSAGICGSDLKMLEIGFPLAHTLGHEMAGELEDGTPVAIEPIAPCGACDGCSRGEYNLCERGPEMVLGVGLDGGMAERVRVPARALVPLATGVPLADACLIEPLAVAVHGLRKAGLPAGSRLAVIGGGAIGLCAVAAAVANGCTVDLFARHDAQSEAGARLGAGDAAASDYPIVLDCAGTESSARQAAELARPGGTLLLLASYWEGMTLPGDLIPMKELTLVPASMYCRSAGARDIDIAASMLTARPSIADALISHRLPLDAAEEAFRIAGDRKAGAIKVVLEP